MTTCVVCGKGALNTVVVSLDQSRLVRCAECGSWTYLPRLTPELQIGLHNTSEYFAHPYFQHRRRSMESVRRRCQQVFTIIGKEVPVQTLRGEYVLDIGCDTGVFIQEAARMFNFTPVGIDVSLASVREARVRGMEAYQASIEDAPAQLKNLAVITAIDLIEHVTRPREFLRAVYERLRPGGVIYLETPNNSSIVYLCGRFLCRLTGARPRRGFERLFPRQHAQYLTPAGLRILAVDCGFEAVRLGARVLPLRDVGASLIVRAGVASLQLLDLVMRSDGLLIYALLRKPLRT